MRTARLCGSRGGGGPRGEVWFRAVRSHGVWSLGGGVYGPLPSWTDWQTGVKTLSSRNFVGGR